MLPPKIQKSTQLRTAEKTRILREEEKWRKRISTIQKVRESRRNEVGAEALSRSEGCLHEHNRDEALGNLFLEKSHDAILKEKKDRKGPVPPFLPDGQKVLAGGVLLFRKGKVPVALSRVSGEGQSDKGEEGPACLFGKEKLCRRTS